MKRQWIICRQRNEGERCFGSELDEKVQAFVKRVREADGPVSSKSVIAGAKGILLAYNHSLLSNYSGPCCAESIVGMIPFDKDEVCTTV